MAKRSAESVEEPRLVVLVAPDGGEYPTNSPVEISRLHFGAGYVLRDYTTFDEALAYLGDEAATPGLLTLRAAHSGVDRHETGLATGGVAVESSEPPGELPAEEPSTTD